MNTYQIPQHHSNWTGNLQKAPSFTELPIEPVASKVEERVEGGRDPDLLVQLETIMWFRSKKKELPEGLLEKIKGMKQLHMKTFCENKLRERLHSL